MPPVSGGFSFCVGGMEKSCFLTSSDKFNKLFKKLVSSLPKRTVCMRKFIHFSYCNFMSFFV